MIRPLRRPHDPAAGRKAPDRRDPADARRIAALGLPALGALVVEPLYNVTDTAIVGHLGRAPLGGLAVATAVLTVTVNSCGFLAMATTSRVAFLRGRGDAAGAGRAATAAYLVSAALGLALGAVVAGAAGPLARLAGAHGSVTAPAVTYLRVAAAGLPFVVTVFAGNGHLRGMADTATPFRILLASNVANVVVEVALVYGAGWGVAGSALGTVLAQAGAAGAFAAVSRRRLRGGGGGPWPPGWAEVRRLLASGAVLVVRSLALLTALSGSTVVAARLGAARLGGHQVALQVWYLAALSLDALAVPAQILVGEAFGAGAPVGGGPSPAERVSRRVMAVGLAVSVALGLAVIGLSPVLPAVFTADPAVRHQAALALVFVGLSMPLAAAAFELDGILIGAGDFSQLRRAMLLALAVGFLPLALLTSRFHGLGLAGVWGAMLCWLAVRAGVLGRRWAGGGWLAALPVGENAR